MHRRLGSLLRLSAMKNLWKMDVFEVVLRGAVPACFIRERNGKKLPRGYIGLPLSDKYSQKMLLWATDISDLRPESDMFVVDEVPNES